MMFLTKVAEGMIKVEKKEIKRIRTKEHLTSHYPYTNGTVIPEHRYHLLVTRNKETAS